MLTPRSCVAHMLCCKWCHMRYTLKTNGMPPLLYFSSIQFHLVCDFFKIRTFNIKMWFAKEYNEHFSEFGTSASCVCVNSNYLFAQLLKRRTVIDFSLPMKWIIWEDHWKYVKLELVKVQALETSRLNLYNNETLKKKHKIICTEENNVCKAFNAVPET